MTTVQHPNQYILRKPGCETTLTTYAHMSSSPSKLHYSFGVEKRLPTVRLPSCPRTGYELPSTKSKRGAGFGIGERFSHTSMRERSPPPNTYNIPSVFVPNQTTTTFVNHMVKDKSYCFGTGRESFKKNVIHREKLGPDPCTPGPGQYVPLKPIGEGRLSFKLKYKLDYGNADKVALKHNYPPPGHYDHEPICIGGNLDGKYNFNSEMSSTKARKWDPPTDRFRITASEMNPGLGPGTHETIGGCENGKQVNSLFHSVLTPGFGTGDRPAPQNYTTTVTPSPCHYRLPSDFGYVDVKPRTNLTPLKVKKSRQNRSPSPRGTAHDSLYSTDIRLQAIHMTAQKSLKKRNSESRNYFTQKKKSESVMAACNLYGGKVSKTQINFYKSSHKKGVSEIPGDMTIQPGKSAGGFNRQRNSMDQNQNNREHELEMKKCETVGNATPFEHKNTQMSSFMNNQGDSTVHTKSEFDQSRFGATEAQSPMKFEANSRQQSFKNVDMEDQSEEPTKE